VPGADQNPRLRFWQWYSFGGHDFGRVQIKAGTNNWYTLQEFSGYSGATWSYPSYDLSTYAGQTVQFGFYFESHGYDNWPYGWAWDVSAGWYVDEVAVLTGPTAPLVPNVVEDFEGTNFWAN
jgi:hypothetical protein